MSASITFVIIPPSFMKRSCLGHSILRTSHEHACGIVWLGIGGKLPSGQYLAGCCVLEDPETDPEDEEELR